MANLMAIESTNSERYCNEEAPVVSEAETKSMCIARASYC